jgi:hypothetical protein
MITIKKFLRHPWVKLIAGILPALLVPIVGTLLTDAPVIWPVATLVYNIGLLYSFSQMPQKTVRVVFYSIAAAAFFVIEASFFFSYYLQNAGFNDAFFYHIRSDLIYAGVREYLPALLLVLGCLVSFLILSSSFLAEERFKKTFGVSSMALLSLVVGLFISPSISDLVLYAENQFTTPTAQDLFENFPELQASPVSGEFIKPGKKNIVLIYAESLNQGYFDDHAFPDLLPNLTRLREQSIDFSNVSQGVGAGWTIGGMVASQCGYPLTPPLDIDDNSLGMLDEFLPSVTCLGDLLKQESYHLTFLGGADSRFAGKGDFLRSHGYNEVLDRDDLLEATAAGSYYNKWGAFDDTLFDFAIQKFSALSLKKFPFLLTLLTLDTHDGYLSKSCGSYGSNDSRFLSSFHCTDLLISRFIEQIRNSPYSGNTVIIVLSDHLEWTNEASSLLRTSRNSDRLTFFVNTPDRKTGKNSNPGLHYDIAPTILDLVGYKINGQMGLGLPLTRGPGYLPGKFGENEWKKQSSNLTAIGKSLWNNKVALDQRGITFSASDLSLTLGGREFDLPRGWINGTAVPLPIIFIFNEKSLELERIMTHPIVSKINPETLSEELLENNGKLAFVISTARYLPDFSEPRRGPDQWVFYFGKPGGESFTGGPLPGDLFIPYDMISELRRSKMTGRILRKREKV